MVKYGYNLWEGDRICALYWEGHTNGDELKITKIKIRNIRSRNQLHQQTPLHPNAHDLSHPHRIQGLRQQLVRPLLLLHAPPHHTHPNHLLIKLFLPLLSVPRLDFNYAFF